MLPSDTAGGVVQLLSLILVRSSYYSDTTELRLRAHSCDHVRKFASLTCARSAIAFSSVMCAEAFNKMPHPSLIVLFGIILLVSTIITITREYIIVINLLTRERT